MAELIPMAVLCLGYKVFKYTSGCQKDAKMRASAPEIELGRQNQVFQVLSGLLAGMYAADGDHEADASAWWRKLGYEELSLKDMHYPEKELAMVGESGCRVRLTLFRRKHERLLSQPAAATGGESRPTTTETPLPRYVVAIRGSVAKSLRAKDILTLGLCSSLNKKHFQSAEPLIQQVVKRFSAENVWLTGHSLGAAIALAASRSLALQGKVLQTHVFDAPNFTVREFSVKMKNVSKGEIGPGPESTRMTAKLTVGKVGAGPKCTDYEKLKLAGWTPHLYVNPKGSIRRKYMKQLKRKRCTSPTTLKHPQSKPATGIITFTAPVVKRVARRALHRIT